MKTRNGNKCLMFFMSYLFVLHKNDFCWATDNISLWAQSAGVNSKSSSLFSGSTARQRTVGRYCGHAITRKRKCSVHPEKGTGRNLSATNHRYNTAGRTSVQRSTGNILILASKSKEVQLGQEASPSSACQFVSMSYISPWRKIYWLLL